MVISASIAMPGKGMVMAAQVVEGGRLPRTRVLFVITKVEGSGGAQTTEL